MSRRSSRLVSGGYYNSDEESDSSTVTNISYRENPVKVFKKKAGTRKAASRTPNKANNASDVTPATPVDPVLIPCSLDSQNQPTMRTIPYTPTIATPRPALTSSCQSQRSTQCHLVAPEKSTNPMLFTSSVPGLYFRPQHKDLSQSGMDSSGYSSSEGGCGRPLPATTSVTKVNCKSGPSRHRSRISSAFYTLVDSTTLVAAGLYSKILGAGKHLVHSKVLRAAANYLFSSQMKRNCGLALLILLILLCIWFLLPLFTSFISHMTVTKPPPQTQPKSQPVNSVPPPPQPNTIPAPVVDPAVVSAVVEAKMQHFLKELEVKQEHHLFQMKETQQLDVEVMKSKFAALDSDIRDHVAQEVAGLSVKMKDHQTKSQSAAASLSLKIETLEAQNAKLSQELLAMQLMPSPTPCPDTTTSPIQNTLTPELQQAMEKWLTNRIMEQEAIRLDHKGSCTDCSRPMADKMADFALETQGASVISTRCSETYRIRSACVTLFGFPLWYPSESPRTVIQGYPVLLPGKCWAFHGVQGTLVISLSHPIRITHVTLDHLPRYNAPTGRIDSAPKDFEVYGMRNDSEEGTLLGTFTYDENGDPTQTFELPNPSNVYQVVELRVLSNWGHIEYTCLYRFRVHGKITST